MNQKSCRVSESACRVSKYSEISTDVWNIFKKYLPTDADLITFADDIHLLDQKYNDQDTYEFMKKLMKVYFYELNRIKGLSNGDRERKEH